MSVQFQQIIYYWSIIFTGIKLHFQDNVVSAIRVWNLESIMNYITMTSYWSQYRLKSPAWGLFIQPFIQAQIKENIKTPRHWPLWGKFNGNRWIPRNKGPVKRKMFPLDDVIIIQTFHKLSDSVHTHQKCCFCYCNLSYSTGAHAQYIQS